MNILLLTQDFPPMPGGIATFLSELSAGLVGRGHDIRVLAPEIPESAWSDLDQPYSVVRYPVPGRMSSLRIGYHILKQVFRKKPDVIFVGHLFATRGLGVLLVKHLFRIPYVILIHAGHLPLAQVSGTNRITAFMLLRHANLLLANSIFTRNLLIEQGLPEEKMKILYPGVDIDYFSPAKDKEEIEKIRKTYCDLDASLIVNAARLVPKKNQTRIIHAISAMVGKGKRIKCVIAGDGPERGKLEALTRTLRLSDEVTLAGNLDRENVLNLFRAADIVALPSTLIKGDGHHESFGIVAMEAAACGKPVIVGSLGGQPEAVINGETGLVIDGDDVSAIGNAIETLIEDEHLATQLGDAGRRRAVAEFSWETIAEKAEAMLVEISRT